MLLADKLNAAWVEFKKHGTSGLEGDAMLWNPAMLPNSTATMAAQIEPFNPSALVSREGLRIFSKMRRDDQVKAALALKKHAVVATGWIVESPEGKSTDWEVTRFVEEQLKELEGTFEACLVEILSALDYGFSVTEKVYEPILEGEFSGKVGLKSLKTKNPLFIEFDHDAFGNILPDGILQRTLGGMNRHHRNKFIKLTYQGEFQNHYGVSDLEAAYKPWWTKENAYTWLSMLLERFGIPPIFALYNPSKFKGALLDQLKTVISRIQANTQGVIPRTSDDDLELWSPELAGQVTSVFIPALDRFDRDIARAILMPGLLGVTSDSDTGSLARARVQFDVFILVVNFIREVLAESSINEQLIRQMVDLNFNTDVYPIWKLNPITDDVRLDILENWTKLTDTGVVISTGEDEQHIRNLIDFPERDVEERPPPSEVEPEPEPEPEPDPGDEDDPDEGPQGEEPEAGISEKSDAVQRKANRTKNPTAAQRKVEQTKKTTAFKREANGPEKPDDPEREVKDQEKPDPAKRDVVKKKTLHDHRPLTQAESRVDFAEINRVLDASEQQTIDDMAKAIARARDRIIARVRRAGVSVNLIKNLPDLRVKTRLSAVMRRQIRDSFLEGREQATAEIGKAKKLQEEPGFVPADAMRFLGAKAFEVAGVIDERVVEAIRTELGLALKLGLTTGETVERLAEVMEPWTGDPSKIVDGKVVTPSRLETIVRTNTTEAFNQGRLVEFRDPGLDGFVTGVQYSAILDERTTEICRHLDAKIFRTDDAQLDRFTPPNHFNAIPAGAKVKIWSSHDGGWKNIEDLRVGMKVLTHAGRWKPITETMSHETWPEEIVLHLAGGKELTLTDDHPVLTDRGWVCAGDLQDTDQVVTLGGPCKVCGVWTAADYCSRKCRYAGVVVHRECEHCGDEIKPKGKKKNKRFCSQACMGAAMRTLPPMKCQGCGKPLIGRWHKAVSRHRRFCSQGCYFGYKGETGIEKTVRKWLDDKGITYEPQKALGRYIVDFYLPEHRTIVEVDGDYWHTTKQKSAEKYMAREGYLLSLGLIIVHVPQSAVQSGRFEKTINMAIQHEQIALPLYVDHKN